ncbi:MAG: hypothetical protein LC114_20175 [Bryobacterales bacterium]|nr:hypothetical protein [Bryobacterales bacterium]
MRESTLATNVNWYENNNAAPGYRHEVLLGPSLILELLSTAEAWRDSQQLRAASLLQVSKDNRSARRFQYQS